MKYLMIVLYAIFLLSAATFAQQINIHTSDGMDVYNLTDIDSITFTLDDTSASSGLTDIDGNVYQTVKIGNQVWMAENLKVTHYRNGDEIPDVTGNSEWVGLSTGAYCSYNDVNSNADTYGMLYNWYAVDDSRNIAPAGWHVPTDEEWKELEMQLGMSQNEADNGDWRGTNEGSKLKTTSGWDSNGNGTNEVGFTALPAGYRKYSGGSFATLGYSTDWWLAASEGSTISWRRGLNSNNTDIARTTYNKKEGFSVRCVRD